MTDPGKKTVATADPGYGRLTVTLKVNGQGREVSIDPRMTLLDCLREVLHLTGTKKGCDHGQCGGLHDSYRWPPREQLPCFGRRA
jgi:xanthine dehydrogenase YagT iron-sulfur-binding subunit